ncbi:MAG: hypothetical protein SVK54_02075 [candidate division WOR-3 bacterium]|nr:hypothetical protein [candidate division WOR-3 bacterium]
MGKQYAGNWLLVTGEKTVSSSKLQVASRGGSRTDRKRAWVDKEIPSRMNSMMPALGMTFWLLVTGMENECEELLEQCKVIPAMIEALMNYLETDGK